MAYTEGTVANETLNGGSSNDEIYGLEGDDFLYGFDGDDFLVGDFGNDTLDGGTGADTMSGGHGNDTYYVDDIGDTVIEADAIGDTDIVYVTASYFDAGSADLEQIHYYGNGSGTILGSDTDNYIGSSSDDDTLEGRGGDDFLFSGAGDDQLDGGEGNDELDGWQGADTMTGGVGNDVYNVDSAGDVIVEYAGEGIDTVKVRKSSYTLGANLENADLRYYSGSISVTGNSANNVFIMGFGDQAVMGGSGIDTVSYAFTSAVSIDLWTQDYGGEAVDDYMTSIENLTGSAYDDVLRALGTASIIDGGTGGDVMEGRNGGDIYYVDNSGDIVIEAAGGGNDEVRIRSLASYTLPVYVEKLTNVTNHVFTGTGNSLSNEMNGGTSADTLHGGMGHDILNGGDGDDELHGDGEHDILNGGAGYDTLYGGDGNDTYIVDDVNDVIVELIDEGTDHVFTSLTSYTLSEHVENLTFTCTGSGAVDATGNATANIITGLGGDDGLLGMGGGDELRGGAGYDIMEGGDGDDILVGGAGADELFGGADRDIFLYSDGDSGTGSNADRIMDFAIWSDMVDLSEVDADSGTVGDQAFSFIGTAAFSGTAGELRFAFVGTDTWLQGDYTGDGIADFEIVFNGNLNLTVNDFYL